MTQGQTDRNHTCSTRAALWLLFAGISIVFIGGTLGLRYYHVKRIEAWELKAGQIDRTIRNSVLFKSACRNGMTREQLQTAMGTKLTPDKKHARDASAAVNEWLRVDDPHGGYWFWIGFDREGRSFVVSHSPRLILPPPTPPAALLILEQARAHIDCFGWIIWMLLAFFAAVFRNQRRALMWVALAVALLHLATVALMHFGWVSSPTVELHSAGWATSGLLIALTLGTLFPTLHKPTGPLCPECEYNLTGNQSGVCPECGQAIPPTLRQVIRCASAEAVPENDRAAERFDP